jgi:hypothetical protein
MSRPAVPKRAASAIPAPSNAGEHPHPDVFKAIIKDITTGTQQLVQGGKAVVATVKSSTQKVKDFLNK